MSRRIRNRLIHTLNFLQKINTMAETLAARKDYKNIPELSITAQEAAIIIGNKIEAVCGESTHSVQELECYCECVYQLTKAPKLYSALHSIIIKMQKHIAEASRYMQQEISDKLEIVFLPYKAAMWDSLESIWIEASKDTGCNCHVIAIPYYDKDQNGNLTTRHVEKDLYPSYVTLTDEADYNLSQHEPDIVFIHNPYDQCNYVTSVAPMYYSYELKNFTDLLVYVPYFVVSDTISKSFCLVPGVINADIVIVQSELIRQKYLQILRRELAFSTEKVKLLDLEKKVLALGSPKADKVVNMKKKEFSLPDEWKEFFEENLQAGAKAVVLYNTGLDAVLKYGSSALDKINLVFEVCKNHKKIMLWWRPHPLISSTIKSMRPDLLTKYQELTARYVKERIGIYDNTSDLSRAFAYSDAYFGDWSSLVTLYMLTGKPILINNIASPFRIEIHSFVKRKNCLWFTAYNFNYLFFLDLDTHKISLVGEIPGERISKSQMFCSIETCGSYLVLIPANGEGIVRYNPDDEKFFHTYIGNSGCATFAASIRIDDYIYLFPEWGADIMKYHVETNSIEKKVPLSDANITNEKCVNAVARDHSKIFFVTGRDNRVCSYDISTDCYSCFSVGDKNQIYYSALNDGIYLLLFSEEGCIFWNKTVKKSEKIIAYPEGFKPNEIPFAYTCKIKNHVYLLPRTANHGLRLNLNTLVVSVWDEMLGHNPQSQNDVSITPEFFCGKLYADHIYAFSYLENCLKIFDENAHRVDCIPLIIPEHKLAEIKNKNMFYVNETVLPEEELSFYEEENEVNNFEKYLMSLESKEEYIANKHFKINCRYFENIRGTCGKNIYQTIKRMI